MNKLWMINIVLLFGVSSAFSQKVDYSAVSVVNEHGLELTKVTDNEGVCMPIVERSDNSVKWFSNRIIGVSPDGVSLGYVASYGGKTNVYVKEIGQGVMASQRTNRNHVIDFSFSPDGKNICFTEKNGRWSNTIYTTSAKQGFVCRQIVNRHVDYTPTYSSDMSQIYFTRVENGRSEVMGCDLDKNYLSSYSTGINPSPSGADTLLVARMGNSGRYEIWRTMAKTGVEECVVSDFDKDFTTPSLSPDGKWIVFVGTSKASVNNRGKYYMNTDIYVCRNDGSQLTQLTFHAADDLSPAWSADGKYIYFVSQRGSGSGKANVWRMKFLY